MVERLVAAASPLRLIAFGSAVRGDLAVANDLDLLVVEPEQASRYNETVRLQQSLRGILMSVDLVVTSQDRYNERCQIPGTVEFTAHRDGRVLYDSAALIWFRQHGWNVSRAGITTEILPQRREWAKASQPSDRLSDLHHNRSQQRRDG